MGTPRARAKRLRMPKCVHVLYDIGAFFLPDF